MSEGKCEQVGVIKMQILGYKYYYVPIDNEKILVGYARDLVCWMLLLSCCVAKEFQQKCGCERLISLCTSNFQKNIWRENTEEKLIN